MITKKIFLFAALTGFASGSAIATESTYPSTGSETVTAYAVLPYQQNHKISCIQMTDLSTVVTGGWACVYGTNPLHQQLDTLALSAYRDGKSCSIKWEYTDGNGHAIINSISCF